MSPPPITPAYVCGFYVITSDGATIDLSSTMAVNSTNDTIRAGTMVYIDEIGTFVPILAS